MLHTTEEPGDPGLKHCERKKPPPGPLPGYLWGPGVLLPSFHDVVGTGLDLRK